MDSNKTPAGDGVIFALDIGTRSVIGVVGHRQGELLCIDAIECVEHPKRAMIDGQIEDIEQVARVAGEVKRRLEETLGVSLRRVAVAAAGRALKTCRASATRDLAGAAVTHRMVYELENSAVNLAHRQMDEGADETRYFCVGHSVVQYKIDGYPFATILEHQGEAAEVEIIATFLPTEVVNSLRRCTDIVGLEIEALTLEPIAAMRAVIPADVRLLNLALVDIGAGTSDIALSRGGGVSGYTMATMAGDEVSEAIIRKYLVDFETAERIKLALTGSEPIAYTDILGFAYTASPTEMLMSIDMAVEMLSKVVCDRILECNDGPPTAIFLVGGGSLTPGLCAAIAEKSGLEANRVAVAGQNFTGRLVCSETPVEGPEFATPLGIALVAMDSEGTESMAVHINGRRVRLFTGETASVMDALLAAGYRYSDLMGRNGRSLTFLLNGARKRVRGTPYTAAELTLNGKPASLSGRVETGGEIEIVPARLGKDATAKVADFAEGVAAFTVELNGLPYPAGLRAYLNSTPAEADEPVQEQDALEIVLCRTVGDLCREAGLSCIGAAITLNGEESPLDALLHPGDRVCCETPKGEADALLARQVAARSMASLPQMAENLPPQEPEEAAAPQAELPPALDAAAKAARETAAPAVSSGQKHSAASLRIELNGRTLVLPPKAGGEAHLLLDLLPLLDIDLAHPKGNIQLLRNGSEAAYMDVLCVGDCLEIGWDTNGTLL